MNPRLSWESCDEETAEALPPKPSKNLDLRMEVADDDEDDAARGLDSGSCLREP